jgi:hypothetical protein
MEKQVKEIISIMKSFDSKYTYETLVNVDNRKWKVFGFARWSRRMFFGKHRQQFSIFIEEE